MILITPKAGPQKQRARSMRKDKKHRLVLTAILGVGVAALPGAPSAVQASTYYVATTGSDKARGTIGSPWLTIGKAAKTLTVGDTVYVRCGTYCEFVRFSASGTSNQPIRVLAYSNEVAIIDGQRLGGYLGLGTNKTTGSKAFLDVDAWANYVTLSGFTPRNGSVGISSKGANAVIRNMTSSNMWQHGILVGGDNSLVENNTVSRASLANNLAVGIDAPNMNFVPEHPLTRQITIRGNTVSYIGKGEGILTWMTDGTIIENNVVYDCGAENIYISDARNTVCRYSLSY